MKPILLVLIAALLAGTFLFWISNDLNQSPTQISQPHRVLPADNRDIPLPVHTEATHAQAKDPTLPAGILQTVPSTLPPGVAHDDKIQYTFSGPYTHSNLTLYLVHGEDALKGTFLTLQEALEQKKVKVYETGEVNQLSIENLSPADEVFVQAGDIVKGGRQDRMIGTDFIVPRQSGKMPIDSFCVEHGRWSQRGGEASGQFSSSTEQAPGKELKLAAKSRAAQGDVWKEVSENQTKLAKTLEHEVKSRQSESSLELTLETQAVRETADDYIKALSAAINGKKDAVGFVFAINGKVNNADIYATHDLFVKLWPKLLKSAAIEAIAEYQKNQKFSPVAREDVQKLVQEPEGIRPVEKSVSGGRVKVSTRETSENILFETSDEEKKGSPVHRNFIKK